MRQTVKIEPGMPLYETPLAPGEVRFLTPGMDLHDIRQTAVGFATRDIRSGESIAIVRYPDGRLECEAIDFSCPDIEFSLEAADEPADRTEC